MSKNSNEKNEKNEKIVELLAKAPEKSTLYQSITNLKNGKKSIVLTDKGYEKLTAFFYNQENINDYKIGAYYIERVNDLKHKNENKYDIDGVIKTTTSYYYKPVYDDSLEYELFKTVLDEL